MPHAPTDEIGNFVRRETGAVWCPSVHDSLGILADRGILRRNLAGRSPAQNEDPVDSHHRYLFCRKRGVSVDLPRAVGYQPCVVTAADPGCLIDEAEVNHRDAGPFWRSEGIMATSKVAATPVVSTHRHHPEEPSDRPRGEEGL